IFRLIFVAEGAAAKTDKLPFVILNGEHQTVTKGIVKPVALFAPSRKPKCRRMNEGRFHRAQIFLQSVPLIGRVADVKTLNCFGRTSAAAAVLFVRMPFVEPCQSF